MRFIEFALARLEQLKIEPRVPGGESEKQGGINQVHGLIDLVRKVKPHSVLEIGSHRGVSTEVFLLHCPRVVALDSWENAPHACWGVFFDEFQDRLGGYPNLEVHRAASPDGLARFADHEFDLVYIDGEHDYESVKRDILATKRLVKPGGWMSGHDHWMPGVQRAVDETMFNENPDQELFIFSDSSWLIKR